MSDKHLDRQNIENKIANAVAHIPLFGPAYPFFSDLATQMSEGGLDQVSNEMMTQNPQLLPVTAFLVWNISNKRKIYQAANNKTVLNEELVQEGPYAQIRHPEYLHMRTNNLGFFLMYPTWTGAASVATFYAASEWLARREEQYCLDKYGDDYQSYMEQTPRWIPKKYQQKLDSLKLSLPSITSLFH